MEVITSAATPACAAIKADPSSGAVCREGTWGVVAGAWGWVAGRALPKEVLVSGGINRDRDTVHEASDAEGEVAILSHKYSQLC